MYYIIKLFVKYIDYYTINYIILINDDDDQAYLDSCILHEFYIQKCTIYVKFVQLFKCVHNIYLTNNHTII